MLNSTFKTLTISMWIDINMLHLEVFRKEAWTSVGRIIYNYPAWIIKQKEYEDKFMLRYVFVYSNIMR